jgi:hypothetical protein
MERILVSSTNISSIGYDGNTQTLEIEFHNGGIYQYFDVSVDAYQGLIQAASVGQYFAQHIKGYFRFVKV